MIRKLRWLAALTLAIPVTAFSATVTFDDAVDGQPFFNFDSDDVGSDPDVIFSTLDPFGFNTTGPGSAQRFIQEPGLEGTTSLNPDLRVDLLRGAVGEISFGFATIDTGQVTFSAFDAADQMINQVVVDSVIFTDSNGNQSGFPENEVVVDLGTGVATYGLFDFQVFAAETTFIDCSTASGECDPPIPPDSDGGGCEGCEPEGPLEVGATAEPVEFEGRYVIDNFTYDPSSVDPIGEFEGALPSDPVFGEVVIVGGVPSFEFDLDIVEGGLGNGFPIFIDPDFAVGYEYDTGGSNLVTSVLIPSPLSNGDDMFTLNLGSCGSFGLQAGVSFDIMAACGFGLDSFSITDIDISELLDPTDNLAFVTGLTFASAGPTSISQTPIIETLAPVPAPGALLLFGSVFALFAGRRVAGKRKTA